MVEIRNAAGEVVDMAHSKHTAFNIVMYLDRTNPAAGPHTCY